MRKSEYTFTYEVYESIDELVEEDAFLLKEAQYATRKAYAPYSHFKVGTAARLTNGVLVTGANQENASYPAGICAERVLLSSAAAQYPDVPIATMAVSYEGEGVESDHPISPCGICRQSLQEFEQRTHHPVRLILGGKEGKVFILSAASQLLPLAFTADELL
jgi:cytidine deaminase